MSQATVNDEFADLGSAINSIKTGIATRLIAQDPSVVPQFTEYFNNTFAPDLVLTWPSRSRQVFLRTSSNGQYLLEDLEVIGGSSPIVLTLGDDGELDNDELAGSAQIQEQALASDSLVGGASALEALVEPVRARSLGDRVARVLLQGGRGYVGAGRGATQGAELASAVEGVENTDASLATTALDLVEELLQPKDSKELESILLALWVSNGGRDLDFPRAFDLTHSSAEDLRSLIELGSLEDSQYWERLARKLNFRTLAQVVIEPGDNSLNQRFAMLMRNADLRLKSTGCKVGVRSQEVTDPQPATYFCGGGTLGIDAGRWVAFVAPDRLSDHSIGDFSASPAGATNITDTMSRAASDGISISAVRVETVAGRILTYTSPAGDNITADELLQAMQDTLGPDSPVTSISTPVRGETLVCDFTSGTASSHSRKKYYVGDLFRVAIPLLASPNTRESAELIGLLSDVLQVEATADDQARTIEGSQISPPPEAAGIVPSSLVEERPPLLGPGDGPDDEQP